MTAAAFALVLCSAVLHATWNFLLKTSDDKKVFLWAMCAIGGLFALGPGVAFAIADGFGWTALGFGVGSALIHAVYAYALASSYEAGDLSSIYPVARGMGPALVPIFAVILLGEHVSGLAAAGIVLVVVGIYATHIDARLLRDLSHPLRALAARETRLAFLTGAIIATYTLWDKAAINEDVHPITLIAFSIGGNCILLTPFTLFGAGKERLANEWARHKRRIVTAAILGPAGYAMVLIALMTSRVSYIAPAREVGIVLGAAMGVLLLDEGYGMTRIWGAALIVGGCIVLGLAP
jgi:uncharacterized membrane protein